MTWRIDCLPDTGVYVFGPPPMPDPAAWEVYEAIMQDAEDRGEGTTVRRFGVLTFIGWRPTANCESGAVRDA
jgi:hypothetical protein